MPAKENYEFCTSLPGYDVQAFMKATTVGQTTPCSLIFAIRQEKHNRALWFYFILYFFRLCCQILFCHWFPPYLNSEEKVH